MDVIEISARTSLTRMSSRLTNVLCRRALIGLVILLVTAGPAGGRFEVKVVRGLATDSFPGAKLSVAAIDPVTARGSVGASVTTSSTMPMPGVARGSVHVELAAQRAVIDATVT